MQDRLPSAQVFERPSRAWQRMLSGRRLDLLDPDPECIEIADIAHGLARLARWNGQTAGPCAFSVAQHAVIVERIADETAPPFWNDGWRLAALLHDSAEYVIGDLISPFKSAIGLDYKAFELRLMAAIHLRFGLPGSPPDEITSHIKAADRVAAYFEATRLAGFTAEEAETYFGQPDRMPSALRSELDRMVPVAPEIAQAMFLARFDVLSRGAAANGHDAATGRA